MLKGEKKIFPSSDLYCEYKLAKTKYRQGRYTLWTGDIGLAIYLWDCIQSKAKFPTIDVF